MKLFRYATATLLAAMALAAANVSARGKAVPSIYVFGFAASFTDSVVYFTDVQKVDSAWIDTKTKFLLGRDNYSYQLENFLAAKRQEQNRTCLVMYGHTQKEAEKKYLKMKKLYTEKSRGMFDVRYINEADFKFQPIDMSYEVGETVTTAPTAQ